MAKSHWDGQAVSPLDGSALHGGPCGSSTGTASDSALMVAVARRQQDAFAEVYRRHAGAVLGLAQRLLRTHPAAEEVVQEVFIRLWSEPERFDPERGSLRSYLLAMSHGRAVDALRDNSVRQAREDQSSPAAARTTDARYDLEAAALGTTMDESLRQAMGGLGAAERKAIALAYFDGYTYRDVAALLQKPEGMVKSHIRTGLRQLHGAL